MSDHNEHENEQQDAPIGEAFPAASANGVDPIQETATDGDAGLPEQEASLDEESIVFDDDPWIEDAPVVRRGPIARGRAWWQHRWNYYLHNGVPKDDEAPAGLPVFLHGPRGRLILGTAALCVVGVWILVMMQIFI